MTKRYNMHLSEPAAKALESIAKARPHLTKTAIVSEAILAYAGQGTSKASNPSDTPYIPKPYEHAKGIEMWTTTWSDRWRIEYPQDTAIELANAELVRVAGNWGFKRATPKDCAERPPAKFQPIGAEKHRGVCPRAWEVNICLRRIRWAKEQGEPVQKPAWVSESIWSEALELA